jgi:hypothetical protein
MSTDQTDMKLQKLFAEMSKNFFTHAFESLLDSKRSRSSNMAIFLALAIAALAIVISGVEPVKIFFRKNFGSEGISTFRLGLSVLGFGILAGISYHFFANYSHQDNLLGSRESFLHTAMINAAIALFLAIKGYREIKAQNDTYQPIYRGDSVVFDFLISSGISQNTVQNFVEPLCLLIIGGALITYNEILGSPLIMCAVAYWIFLLGETLLGLGYARSILANKGHAYSQNRKFSKAK